MTRTTLRLRTAGLAALTALVAVPVVANPAYAAAPSVVGVSPSSRAEGSARVPLTVTGTNLVSGSIVFISGGVLVDYAQGGSVASGNGTTLSGVFIEVPDDSPVGPRQVSVTSPDRSTGSCNGCFTVTAGPSITSVSPAAGSPGQTLNVVITGTGFQPGATVTVGNGVTVSNVSQPSGSTAINATFTIANNASSGTRPVTVTNVDGSTAVRPNGFSVGSAVTVTGVSPNTRGRGVQNQTVVIAGTGFGASATVAFSGTGVTLDSTSVVSATRIEVVVDIAANAPLGQRNVTVTNPGGLSGTCASCFNVTDSPVVTAASPSSAGRGRQALDVVLTGAGFLSGATVSFGPDITVTSVTVTGSTSLVARINVAFNAGGPRDISVTNPDGGRGFCSCSFTITPGRAMLVEVIDTRGTTATADDVVTAHPVSGSTYSLRVTAKQGTTTSPTDSTYNATPALTSTDTTFVAGTCAAAVNGVANCTGFRFGDLGMQTLVVRGTSNADSDRNGSVIVVVQPTALVFATAPTSGEVGDPLTYTVVPQVGITGAKIDDYDGRRTLLVTGGGSNLNNNATLSCPNATCSFTLTFSTTGTKTVAVTDNGTPARSTPVVTVQIAPAVERGTYTPLVPSRILDTRSSNDGDGLSSALTDGTTTSIQVAGRGGVPATGVSAVVVNVTAVRPTASGFLALFPAGSAVPTSSNLNFRPGQVIANLATVKIANGQLSLYNSSGGTDVVLDVVGWFSTTPASAGGRTIAITPARILDTRPDGDDVSSPVGPGSVVTRQVLGVGGVPASGVTAVVVNVTAVRATASTFITAYPSDAPLPTASTLNVDPTYRIDGRVPDAVPNLAIVKVGGDGKIALFNKSGVVDLILDVVGYVSSTSTTTAGTFVALPPARVLDTRGAGDGEQFSAPVAPDSAIDLTVLGRGGVPTTGVTAVVLNLTAVSPSSATYLTAYPTGQSRPLASNVNAIPGQVVPNLVVVKVGSGGQAAIYNRSGFTNVVADVVGYLTS